MYKYIIYIWCTAYREVCKKPLASTKDSSACCLSLASYSYFPSTDLLLFGGRGGDSPAPAVAIDYRPATIPRLT